MVGGHTRNKAFKETSMEVARNTRAKQKKLKQAVPVPKQTQVKRRNVGVAAVSSVSIHSETVCETNAQSKDTEIKKLKETLSLMRKEVEEANSRVEEANSRVEKVNSVLKMMKDDKQEGAPMNSVGTTHEGKITKISTLTGQSVAGLTIDKQTSFTTRDQKQQIKDLVAAVETIVNMYCRKEIFPKTKFVTDKWAIRFLYTGYSKKKIAVGNVTFAQLTQVGPKLIHQGLSRWRKNAQHQAMNNYKGKQSKNVTRVKKSLTNKILTNVFVFYLP